jgi:hypothetical protein
MNVMSDTLAALKETFTEADLVPYSTWFHSKTGGTYTVLGVATCLEKRGSGSTNGDRENVERSVIYFGHKYQQVRYREISEFLDGRFKPVPSSCERDTSGR